MAFTTRVPMLRALQRNENAAWEEFLEFYGPLIAVRARHYRLSPGETEELRQEVCVSIFAHDSVDAYTPERGRFRDYLCGIVNHRAIDLIRRRPSPPHGAEDSPAVEPSEPPENEAVFEQQWRDFLLEKATAEVRARCEENTFVAFQLHARRGLPARQVAEILGITEQQVYLASSRIIQRLRDTVARLKAELGE